MFRSVDRQKPEGLLQVKTLDQTRIDINKHHLYLKNRKCFHKLIKFQYLDENILLQQVCIFCQKNYPTNKISSYKLNFESEGLWTDLNILNDLAWFDDSTDFVRWFHQLQKLEMKLMKIAKLSVSQIISSIFPCSSLVVCPASVISPL